jgi:hypothetical protein
MVAQDVKYLCTSGHMTSFLKTELSHSFHISTILVKKTVIKGINQTVCVFKVARGAEDRVL